MDKRFKGKKRVRPVRKTPKSANAGSTGKKLKKKQPLLSSGPATSSSSAPVDKDNWNRADMTLDRMTKNHGIPRQKVRMK
jgi:hypothetical protein